MPHVSGHTLSEKIAGFGARTAAPAIGANHQGLLLFVDLSRRLPCFHRREPSRLAQLAFNPLVRDLQSVFEPDRRLPPQHLVQQRVVAVTPAYALWLRKIMTLLQLFPSQPADQVNQTVDRDE